MKIEPFPELVAYAEEEARLYRKIKQGAEYDDTYGARQKALKIKDAALKKDITIRVAILCDLSLAASRRVICALIARKIKWLEDDVIYAIHTDAPWMADIYKKAGVKPLNRRFGWFPEEKIETCS